jgi:Zn-dependent M28 family amino/carboxypeptidase
MYKKTFLMMAITLVIVAIVLLNLPKPVAIVIDQARYKADLKEISSDYFQGRGPGAVGEKRFVPWLEAQYKAVGLMPGNGKSYTQAVPMTEITNEIVQPLRFKSAHGETALKLGDDYVLSSRDPAALVELKDSELIFMGYGVDQASENWNDYQDVDVKGKTVVVLINDPGFHVGDATLFKGKAMTYAGRWGYKFEEAARKGAVGCLIVHDDLGASYGWEVVKNGAARPEFELAPKPGQIAPLKAQGWISAATATALFANAGLDLTALRSAASQRGFKPVPLKTTASASIAHKIRSATSQNVLGLIKGSEKPDEVVIYSAHWDHLGRNFGLVGDQIFNGAIDNGTGVAALLEMSRALIKQRPKRSVLMLAVTLEESGLLGSRYYAENPVFPLHKTLANINMDALKLIGPSRDIEVIGIGNSELEDILKPFAALQNRELVPEPTPENGFFYRSDHFNFAKVGVPALYIKTGQNHVEQGESYGKQWAVQYNAERYHKPGDAYDDAADYRGVVQDLQLMVQVGLSVANSDRWPNWYESSEFRAVRDASLKAHQ